MVTVVKRMVWFVYKKIRTRERRTRAEGIATLTEQLARRAKRNIKEFPSLDLDPSLDDQMDAQTNKRKGRRERERERERKKETDRQT